MLKKKSPSQVIFSTCNTLFMLVLMIAMFYPLWYVFCGSLSNSSQLVGYRGILYKPLGFNLSAYQTVFKNTLLLRSFGNTIFIVVVGTFVNLVMT